MFPERWLSAPEWQLRVPARVVAVPAEASGDMLAVSLDDLALFFRPVEGMDRLAMEELGDDFHACQPVPMDAFVTFRLIHAHPRVSGRLMLVGLKRRSLAA